MVLYVSWRQITGVLKYFRSEFWSVDRGISPSKSSLLGGVKPEHDMGTGKRAETYPPVLSAEQAAIMRELKPFLKAIADVNRLAILQELSQQDGLNVLDLADRLVLSQPLTSWHLLILKRAHLVVPTHLGRQH